MWDSVEGTLILKFLINNYVWFQFQINEKKTINNCAASTTRKYRLIIILHQNLCNFLITKYNRMKLSRIIHSTHLANLLTLNMFHVMSLKTANFTQTKNKTVQNLGQNPCRNGFNLQLDGNFQLWNSVQAFLEHTNCQIPPQKVTARVLRLVRSVAIKILPQTAQGTSLTRLNTPENDMKKWRTALLFWDLAPSCWK